MERAKREEDELRKKVECKENGNTFRDAAYCTRDNDFQFVFIDARVTSVEKC